MNFNQMIAMFTGILSVHLWAGGHGISGGGDPFVIEFKLKGIELCQAFESGAIAIPFDPERVVDFCAAVKQTRVVMVDDKPMEKGFPVKSFFYNTHPLNDGDPLIVTHEESWLKALRRDLAPYEFVFHEYLRAAGIDERQYEHSIELSLEVSDLHWIPKQNLVEHIDGEIQTVKHGWYQDYGACLVHSRKIAAGLREQGPVPIVRYRCMLKHGAFFAYVHYLADQPLPYLARKVANFATRKDCQTSAHAIQKTFETETQTDVFLSLCYSEDLNQKANLTLFALGTPAKDLFSIANFSIKASDRDADWKVLRDRVSQRKPTTFQVSDDDLYYYSDHKLGWAADPRAIDKIEFKTLNQCQKFLNSFRPQAKKLSVEIVVARCVDSQKDPAASQFQYVFLMPDRWEFWVSDYRCSEYYYRISMQAKDYQTIHRIHGSCWSGVFRTKVAEPSLSYQEVIYWDFKFKLDYFLRRFKNFTYTVVTPDRVYHQVKLPQKTIALWLKALMIEDIEQAIQTGPVGRDEFWRKALAQWEKNIEIAKQKTLPTGVGNYYTSVYNIGGFQSSYRKLKEIVEALP